MKRLGCTATVTFIAALLGGGTADAGTLQLFVCGSWSHDPGPFRARSAQGFRAIANCGAGGSGLLLIKTGGAAHRGWSTGWETRAPNGIAVNGIWVVHAYSKNIGDGHGYTGEFFWNEGTSGHAEIGANYGNVGCCRSTFNSRHVGWLFSCNRARCSDYAYLQVGEIALAATENRGPDIVAPGGTNLWLQRGWVRGSWPLEFTASDPSGVCDTTVEIGNRDVQGPAAVPYRGNWQQCPNQTFSRWVDTAGIQASGGLGEGSMRIQLRATNAAGVTASAQEAIQVDNVAPSVSLSGPLTAPTTAGTQYITAHAGAGLSGVAGIDCSVDGGRGAWYPGQAAAVPVSGFGVHHVVCVSYNNAKDGTGAPGASAPASWTIAIRQPSISTLSFARIVGRAHCVRTRQRIRIPAQWVTVKIGGRPVRVRVPAQTRVVTRLRCRPRVAVQRSWVHGHWVTRRHPVTPRTLRSLYRRVRFGAGTSVSGWLGGTDGEPLAGHRVQILTAPDNGSYAFAPVATVTTGVDGGWTARLPAGPSRLVKAVFAGDTASEPAQSAQARLEVPASLTLSITPRRTSWGGTIAISGHLAGGWIPPAGELVVLWVGWPGGRAEVGHLYAKGDGAFRSPYTFLRGNGTERYRFWAATARESDYPYAPHRSRSVRVTVHP